MDKITIGRTNIHARHEHNIEQHWWADCVACPLSKGFSRHNTHADALAWASAHVDEHNKSKVNVDGH